jgi:hypothetical protein
LRGLLIIDNGHSSWPFFDDQPINTAAIECVDPLSYGTMGYDQCIANQISVGTGQKHLYRPTACSGFIGSEPANLLELFDCGVLPIGNE